MPIDKNKRKRSKTRRNSSSRSCSTSTSSSSSCDDKNKKRSKKGLRKQIRKLKEKLSNRSGRYQGKIDSVPVFTGNVDERQNVQQWLRTVDSTGDMFDWDDKARIFCMTNKLKGNAKTWYLNQENTNISWRRWKKRLAEAFPIQQCVFAKLKEMVNVEREPRQNLMDFYYQKLSLGQYCKLDDHTIVDIITNTVNDPFLQSGIRAASCVSTKQLLHFLISNTETRRLHSRKVVGQGSDNKFVTNKRLNSTPNESKQKCYLCGKEGHKKAACFKNVSEIQCSFCKLKGHVEANCFKKERLNKTNKHNINTMSCKDTKKMNEKFYKSAKINGTAVSAYVDFGSSCNTMKLDIFNKLKCIENYSETDVVIVGYGGSTVQPLFVINADIEIDDIKMKTNFYVVPNALQTTDVLIGQPVTESESVFVYKTTDCLRLTEQNLFQDWPFIKTDLRRED